MSEHDDALVAAARAGDPDAWRDLHRMHAGRLLTWLHARPSGDAMVAPEDVAAEAWLVASHRIADFSGSSDDFGGWLFGIARKVSANARRTHQRRGTNPSDEVTQHLPVLAGHDDDVAQQQWLRDVLATLPPRERDVVALVDGLGMDRSEAAKVLGISAVSLRVARHRGLKKVERLLGDAAH